MSFVLTDKLIRKVAPDSLKTDETLLWSRTVNFFIAWQHILWLEELASFECTHKRSPELPSGWTMYRRGSFFVVLE